MREYHLLILCVFFALLALPDCSSDGGTADGDQFDGDTNDGDATEGDSPEGDMTDGDDEIVADGDEDHDPRVDGDVESSDLDDEQADHFDGVEDDLDGDPEPPDGDLEESDEQMEVEEDQGEQEPPQFRSLRVSISGEFNAEFDLANGDVRYVLPVDSDALFSVLTLDNESAVADLVVEVIDRSSSETVAGQSTEFRNNLWHCSLMVSPGVSYAVRVKDLAGNEAVSDYSLILPSQAKALPGNRTKRFYQPNQSVNYEWDFSLSPDGTWSETLENEGLSHTGTYESTGEKLHFSERTLTSDQSKPGDNDFNTIEWEKVADYYVDTSYFSMAPFVRHQADQKSDGIAGTWERSHQLYVPGENGLVLAEEVIETLAFSAGRFTLSKTGTSYDVKNGQPINQVMEGDYSIELNEDYMSNYGNFLVRSIDTVDGNPLAEPEQLFELHIIRADHLLISPYLQLGKK